MRVILLVVIVSLSLIAGVMISNQRNTGDPFQSRTEIVWSYKQNMK